MKKILFLIVGVLLFGCSSDSSTETPDVFDSQLVVNGESFTPDRNDDDDAFNSDGVLTSIIADNGDGKQTRKFILLKYMGFQGYTPSIRIDITYPQTQATADGTYYFGQTGDSFATGICNRNEPYWATFNSGSVTVTTLGNNRFKLEFQSASGPVNVPVAVNNTVEGYFDGTFKVGQ